MGPGPKVDPRLCQLWATTMGESTAGSIKAARFLLTLPMTPLPLLTEKLRTCGRLRRLLGQLGQKRGMDVRDDASAGEHRVLEEVVQLLVVAHREADMARSDAFALLLLRLVARQLRDLRHEVLCKE